MSPVDSLRDSLIAERAAASTFGDVHAAVARVTHYNRQYAAGKLTMDGLTCPTGREPSPADLARWVPDCPADEEAKASRTAADTMRKVALCLGDPRKPLDRPDRVTITDGRIGLSFGTIDFATAEPVERGINPDTGEPFASYATDDVSMADVARLQTPGGMAAACAVLIESSDRSPNWVTCCRLWSLAGNPLLPHPLAPLVDAWQRLSPVSSDWDTRQHANLPGPLARTRHVVPARDLADDDSKARLPFDWDAYATPAPSDAPRFEVGYLPTLEPGPSVLPLALLDTFTVGAGRGRGGPVPVPERLLWETILAVPPANRAHAAELRVTLGDLARMVWPGTRWYERKHGPALLRALDYLDTRAIRWRADGQDHDGVRVFTVWRLPHETAVGTEVTLIASLPPVGSHQGPQVDRLALRTLAARGARQHRAMACAACLWDAYATIKGRLVAPTLPVVNRNPAGYVLDARGKLVTERDGRPTRRPTHERAVQTGDREANPEADRYPWLTDRDLLLLCHPEVASRAAGIRAQRHRTIETLTALRDDGLLDFEERYRHVRGGRELEAVRLLPSAAHVETHAARWAARKHNRAGA